MTHHRGAARIPIIRPNTAVSEFVAVHDGVDRAKVSSLVAAVFVGVVVSCCKVVVENHSVQ